MVDNDDGQRTLWWGKDNSLKHEQKQEYDPEGLSAELQHQMERRLRKIENERVNTIVVKRLQKLHISGQ